MAGQWPLLLSKSRYWRLASSQKFQQWQISRSLSVVNIQILHSIVIPLASNVFLDDGDDGLQRTEELSSRSPPSPRRQKSPKSPKIRVLDAIGREQEPDLSNQDRVNSSPSAPRVVDAMGHEIDKVTRHRSRSHSRSLHRQSGWTPVTYSEWSRWL